MELPFELSIEIAQLYKEMGAVSEGTKDLYGGEDDVRET